jgi:quinol-cytochrome oxidoreductase complex cytochrome b subunit
MLPAALAGLIGVHMYLIIRLGISNVPKKDE